MMGIQLRSDIFKFFLMLALTIPVPQAAAESHFALDFSLVDGDANYGISTGWSVYWLEDEGLGSYVNLFTDLLNETDLNSKTALHNYFDSNLKQSVTMIDVGKTWRLPDTDYANYYVGIGYATLQCPSTRLYPNYLRTPTSPCNAENPVKDRYGINVNYGVLVAVKPVVFNIGYHSFLNKVYVGLGLYFE